jgi:CubicO group peptidase (beta-lactamase class C family)
MRGSWGIGFLRRVALYALLAGAGLAPLLAEPARGQSSGPRFRADGVDADGYGRRDGYPSCGRIDYVDKQRCRVATFSNFEANFPSRPIAAPKTASPLQRAVQEPEFSYSWNGRTLTVEDYLNRQPITGFLIARGNTILLERYQYARTDSQRLTSFSMAKTITALLIGLAVRDGAIKSIGDQAQTYAPEVAGTEYGKTPIKALLQMSSGVAFREEYTDPSSDIAVLARGTLLQEAGGSPAVLRRFNNRVAGPDLRWSYSSAETSVLGLVIAGATRRTVSDFAREKLWAPLGAEAAASWVIDATGREVTYAYFNAALRDWARLGLMMAHDGTWAGKEVVPRAWLMAGTTVAPPDPHLRFSRSYWAGYGYQTWLIPGPNRAFALQGYRGQFVLVDPTTKVVLVQTSARAASDEASDRELLALFLAASAQLQQR